MTEYIEREKIWPALNAACVPYNRATAKAIEDIPAADVRPVVRNEKKILDMTCGSRTIWFNKNHPAAVYCDKRREDFDLYFGKARTSLHTCHVSPDVLCDFTALPFPDNTFSLAVFDPPHLTGAKETAWLVKKYGKLDETWPQMLHDGFAEGMRVLKPDGVLIFKWSEYDIPADEVWKAIGQKPLFGHHSGKKSNTFWGCFMKFADCPNCGADMREKS